LLFWLVYRPAVVPWQTDCYCLYCRQTWNNNSVSICCWINWLYAWAVRQASQVCSNLVMCNFADIPTCYSLC